MVIRMPTRMQVIKSTIPGAGLGIKLINPKPDVNHQIIGHYSKNISNGRLATTAYTLAATANTAELELLTYAETCHLLQIRNGALIGTGYELEPGHEGNRFGYLANESVYWPNAYIVPGELIARTHQDKIFIAVDTSIGSDADKEILTTYMGIQSDPKAEYSIENGNPPTARDLRFIHQWLQSSDFSFSTSLTWFSQPQNFIDIRSKINALWHAQNTMLAIKTLLQIEKIRALVQSSWLRIYLENHYQDKIDILDKLKQLDRNSPWQPYYEHDAQSVKRIKQNPLLLRQVQDKNWHATHAALFELQYTANPDIPAVSLDSLSIANTNSFCYFSNQLLKCLFYLHPNTKHIHNPKNISIFCRYINALCAEANAKSPERFSPELYASKSLYNLLAHSLKQMQHLHTEPNQQQKIQETIDLLEAKFKPLQARYPNAQPNIDAMCQAIEKATIASRHDNPTLPNWYRLVFSQLNMGFKPKKSTTATLTNLTQTKTAGAAMTQSTSQAPYPSRQNLKSTSPSATAKSSQAPALSQQANNASTIIPVAQHLTFEVIPSTTPSAGMGLRLVNVENTTTRNASSMPTGNKRFQIVGNYCSSPALSPDVFTVENVQLMTFEQVSRSHTNTDRTLIAEYDQITIGSRGDNLGHVINSSYWPNCIFIDDPSHTQSMLIAADLQADCQQELYTIYQDPTANIAETHNFANAFPPSDRDLSSYCNWMDSSDFSFTAGKNLEFYGQPITASQLQHHFTGTQTIEEELSRQIIFVRVTSLVQNTLLRLYLEQHYSGNKEVLTTLKKLDQHTSSILSPCYQREQKTIVTVQKHTLLKQAIQDKDWSLLRSLLFKLGTASTHTLAKTKQAADKDPETKAAFAPTYAAIQHIQQTVQAAHIEDTQNQRNSNTLRIFTNILIERFMCMNAVNKHGENHNYALIFFNFLNRLCQDAQASLSEKLLTRQTQNITTTRFIDANFYPQNLLQLIEFTASHIKSLHRAHTAIQAAAVKCIEAIKTTAAYYKNKEIKVFFGVPSKARDCITKVTHYLYVQAKSALQLVDQPQTKPIIMEQLNWIRITWHAQKPEHFAKLMATAKPSLATKAIVAEKTITHLQQQIDVARRNTLVAQEAVEKSTSLADQMQQRAELDQQESLCAQAKQTAATTALEKANQAKEIAITKALKAQQLANETTTKAAEVAQHATKVSVAATAAAKKADTSSQEAESSRQQALQQQRLLSEQQQALKSLEKQLLKLQNQPRQVPLKAAVLHSEDHKSTNNSKNTDPSVNTGGQKALRNKKASSATKSKKSNVNAFSGIRAGFLNPKKK